MQIGAIHSNSLSPNLLLAPPRLLVLECRFGLGPPFSVLHPAENECRKFGSPFSSLLSLSLSSQLKRWRRWDFSFFLLHARLINEFAPKWPLTLTLLRLARMPAIIPDRLFLRSSCACHCPLAIRDPPAAPGFVGEKMKGNFCFSALQNEANGRVWLRK